MITVWGISISYYTGKLEAYLRYKNIPYRMDHPYADQPRIKKLAGAIQVPLVQLDDGCWLSDSTPIIAHMEGTHPDRPVMPQDPVVRFIGLLIEDYADEWLWRSAMHYRWSYDHDSALQSRVLADELTTHIRAPRFVRRWLVKRRQITRFVKNDGVTRGTWDHVEAGFFNAMRAMTAMLATRPFLLGSSPSIADIGMMGPMLRHFATDPTPAAIMRNDWPHIAEWVARTWNAAATVHETALLDAVPDDAAAMLREIAETHMVQQRENALAFANGKERFAMTVQGCPYKNMPVSRYRVYCLERLREEFAALSDDHRQQVRTLLTQPEYALLWDADVPATSGHDVERAAPFTRGINVYDFD